MTTSIFDNKFQINGLVDTRQNVISNMQDMCQAAGSFLTYDIHSGKWSVVINRAESATRSFDAATIIGGMQVSGTGLNNLYNSVTVEYPLRDTIDATDSITLEIADADRHDYEPDNDLVIQNQFINEPNQATLVGLFALNQSRIDQTIQFVTDYTAIDLTAGEVISVTHDAYDFDADLFRVVSVNEVDADDGSILVEISAIRYDASVYDTSNLTRYVRSDRNGVRPIGSIGQPNEPQISVYESDSRPRLQVEAVIPDGVVESFELWVSTDNVEFVKVETETRANGGTFTAGDTVVFDYDKMLAADAYVKVRGMNSVTTGPFSAVASYIGYVPSVTAGTIDSSTTILDDNDVDIGALLGANGLLLLLKQFLEDGDTASASGVYNQLFSLYNGATGVDLTDSSLTNYIQNVQAASGGAAIIAATASLTITNISQSTNDTHYVDYIQANFPCPYSGDFQIDVLVDSNSSGANGGRGSAYSEPNDTIRIKVEIYQGGSWQPIGGSGGIGAFFWTDYFITGQANLTGGQTYPIRVSFVNYTETAPSATASFDISIRFIGLQ